MKYQSMTENKKTERLNHVIKELLKCLNLFLPTVVHEIFKFQRVCKVKMFISFYFL